MAPRRRTGQTTSKLESVAQIEGPVRMNGPLRKGNVVYSTIPRTYGEVVAVRRKAIPTEDGPIYPNGSVDVRFMLEVVGLSYYTEVGDDGTIKRVGMIESTFGIGTPLYDTLIKINPAEEIQRARKAQSDGNSLEGITPQEAQQFLEKYVSAPR